MARRLPKPLIPVLVGATALVIGAFAMTSSSYAGVSNPLPTRESVPSPASAPTTPTPTPTPAAAPSPSDIEDLPLPVVTTSKPDKYRDPGAPPATVGACSACV